MFIGALMKNISIRFIGILFNILGSRKMTDNYKYSKKIVYNSFNLHYCNMILRIY